MTPTPVLEVKTGPHILVRAAWYVFVGWWLTAIVMGVAWVGAIFVLLMMVNRLPFIFTLHRGYA